MQNSFIEQTNKTFKIIESLPKEKRRAIFKGQKLSQIKSMKLEHLEKIQKCKSMKELEPLDQKIKLIEDQLEEFDKVDFQASYELRIKKKKQLIPDQLDL